MIIPSPISQSPLSLFHSNPNTNSSFPPSSSHFPNPRSLTTASATCTSAAANSGSSTSSTSSFYEILGISMGATSDEVKSAFRKLVRICHPDVAAKETPADEFMRIHNAYSTLSDPAKRANYDREIFRRHRSFVGLSNLASVNGSRSPVGSRRNWESDQCW